MPDHPSATTALVLGLVGLAGSFLCAGLPSVLGPFAWWTGAKARREIDAEPQRYGGRAAATAGMIMGIVSTVILVLGVALLALLIALIASSDLDDWQPDVDTGGGTGTRTSAQASVQ